ncbi:hypothetical protein Q3O60_14470 [Alkalimonas collagenimarina]|uniref:Adhesin domain-containing protein n=1 Tax=Alkalimonas collagenimarina TaxID=400390 RepID=A0ABT9H254_9GAMM|nr:hypothetical protein [Alkalimonas collagenimarina]MDP4537394.1 hypothetical protein [Alkalimonas collagenimarina]
MKVQLNLAALFGVLLSWSVHADTKNITMELDAAQLQQLHLQVGVGQIKLSTANTDKIQLRVDVTGEKRWWFFSHKVGDIELTKQRDGSKLSLSIDKDNTKQDWQLTIPESLAVRIDLGVGQFFAEQFIADAFVDVSVGQVSANLDTTHYQKILLTAGVGNVQLKNAPKETKSERHLVGGTLELEGSGQASFEASVGVGDISIAHQ